VIPILDPNPESAFPPTELALEYPQGLLAAGGDLSPTRLVNAYRQGIFPWYSDNQPILWWSPAPRCVLFPARVHVSRRLRRRYNQGRFSLTVDQDFEQVIHACAEPRDNQDGTWITGDMIQAYIELHDMGIAHSLEVWHETALVGGIYGLSLGDVFFGESMFSRRTDTSKIALVALCRHLEGCAYRMLDCQVSNPHLISMGAVDIDRETFNQLLQNTAGEDHWNPDFQPLPGW
jgi:leucyl/phenylalanyl-tRNA--protein transferase